MVVTGTSRACQQHAGNTATHLASSSTFSGRVALNSARTMPLCLQLASTASICMCKEGGGGAAAVKSHRRDGCGLLLTLVQCSGCTEKRDCSEGAGDWMAVHVNEMMQGVGQEMAEDTCYTPVLFFWHLADASGRACGEHVGLPVRERVCVRWERVSLPVREQACARWERVSVPVHTCGYMQASCTQTGPACAGTGTAHTCQSPPLPLPVSYTSTCAHRYMHAWMLEAQSQSTCSTKPISHLCSMKHLLTKAVHPHKSTGALKPITHLLHEAHLKKLVGFIQDQEPDLQEKTGNTVNTTRAEATSAQQRGGCSSCVDG